MKKWFSVTAISIMIAWFGWYWFSPVKPEPDPASGANVVNDVTRLNPHIVASVHRPTSTEHIAELVAGSTGPVSIGGGRYSQGGQIALDGSLHLDMRGFNQVVALDTPAKTIAVQSGITWRDIQQVIDPHDLSVKIMQSYANFTVGGSLSVNVHGRYVGLGPIVSSVKSMKLVLADGRIVEASPQHNADIFKAAIGGYGGVGVIAEVTLALADNRKVKRVSQVMALEDYPAWFNSNIRNNDQYVFHNADLYVPDYDSLRAVSWQVTDDEPTEPQRLSPQPAFYRWQPKVAEWVADHGWAKWARQHIADPLRFMSEPVQWRNFQASLDLNVLEPSSRAEYTYALREYFVPVDKLQPFIADMGQIFNEHQVNVLNVSIRHATADKQTLLGWAPVETFALVVYYRQGTSTEAVDATGKWSRALIDAVLAHQGTYYLPYQNHATLEQFQKAYPNWLRFVDIKHRVDPNCRFTNAMWDKYLPCSS